MENYANSRAVFFNIIKIIFFKKNHELRVGAVELDFLIDSGYPHVYS